jgi:hypothetical protein
MSHSSGRSTSNWRRARPVRLGRPVLLWQRDTHVGTCARAGCPEAAGASTELNGALPATSGRTILPWKRSRSARADGRHRLPAALVDRKLAIEGRQLKRAALRSHWAGDGELAPGSV